MTNDFVGLFEVRECMENDKNFILATFLRGLYYGESFFSDVPKNLFMERYKRVAQALVNDPNTTIRVACLPEDKDVILGYSICSGDSVNFCFVKAAWRQKGIAKSLVPTNPVYVVPQHLTKIGKELLTKINNPKYNPFF